MVIIIIYIQMDLVIDQLHLECYLGLIFLREVLVLLLLCIFLLVH